MHRDRSSRRAAARTRSDGLPAGEKCQSGSRLGIGPSVLHRLRGRSPAAASPKPLCGLFLYHARWRRDTSEHQPFACARAGEALRSRRFVRDDATAWNAGGRARDALVVGAGPAGAAAAYWLAERGHRVLVVEKKRFPREKTCGDGLTPRAVRQLHDMGLGRAARGVPALRRPALDRPTASPSSCAWPEHPDFPSYGYVVRRRDLDEMVADAGGEGRRDALAGHRGGRAAGRGRAGRPARWSSARRAGSTETVRARYVVVADGANSRFGRALGHRPGPLATRWAWRSAATSPARSTTSPGSRATSTSATGTATTCPGTAGSSRSATAR